MASEQDMQNRLAAVGGNAAKKKKRGIGVPAVGLALAGAAALGAFALASSMQQNDDVPLETSEVQDFQAGAGNGGRLTFDTNKPESKVEEALIRIDKVLEAPTPQLIQTAATLDSGLAEELAAMRKALAENTAGRDKAIAEAVSGLKGAFEDRAAELEEAVKKAETELASVQSTAEARQNSLQVMLDAEKARREGLEMELQRSDMMSLEAQRMEQVARDAAELEKLQITSPAVIYANGQSAGGSRSAGSTASSKAYGISENEAFLQNAPALQVEEAERMQDPERTLAQGSVVQAVLQTAINSDLPGNAVAVASEPVPSFAGDNILVPRGSKLFGAYRSGIEVNQKRILIVWNRILTPDGTSMQISSVGGDQLGRSGLTGFVDTRFDERFGGAALISLIGAGPSIAAARADDEITSDTLESVGEDLQDAAGTVIAEQLAIAPTIYIDQGASVTVLVDRDVVIW